jgi:uncharacterized sulfatase
MHPLLCCAALALPVQEPAQGAVRPNIVLAIADDQDYEHFGFLGHPLARTPTLDRLAAEGVLFPVAHATPRCRPTLAELLVGRWPHQSGITYNDGQEKLSPRGTLPILLHEAGYATYCGGKFWEGDLRAQGFDRPEQRDEAFGRQGQEDLFRFLEERRDAPFFVWWAPSIPHTPHNPPRELLRHFQGAAIPAPGYCEENARAFQKAERLSLAMGAWLDQELGRLVAKLDELGELEETLFVFLSDNGWSSGLPSKGSPLEKGVRTPLVFRWPVRFAPARLEQLVDVVDVFPTLLDCAGVPIPAGLPGRSLRPLLEGLEGLETGAGREHLFGAAYTAARSDGGVAQDVYALYARSAEWKYILYLKEGTTEPPCKVTALNSDFHCRPGEVALYHLAADPYELANLAGREEHRELEQRLRAELLSWWHDTGGPPLELPEAPR